MAEQVSEIWAGDVLGREKDAALLLPFLIHRMNERKEACIEQSYVLNLDAPWGTGKTFFLKRLRSELQKQSYFAVYVNAWADDHADEPLLAVMAIIDQAINTSFPCEKGILSAWEKVKLKAGKIAWLSAKHSTKNLARKLVGEAGFDALVSELMNDSANSEEGKQLGPTEFTKFADEAIDVLAARETGEMFSRFLNSKAEIATFKDIFELLRVELVKKSTYQDYIFILIDELDRCRPTYSVNLLERIKHIFDIPNVVFVLATDTAQLSSSIKSVYGSNFDSKKYLLRFFDKTYHFEKPNFQNYVKYIFQKSSLKEEDLLSLANISPTKFLSNVFEEFDCKLRDINQCLEMVHDCVTIWRSLHSEKLYLPYLIVLIIFHHRGDLDLFRKCENLEQMILLKHF